MKIYPVTDTINDNNAKNSLLFRLKELADLSTSSHFFLIFERKNADMYLFFTHGLETHQIFEIINHPLVKTFPEKCFLWCDRDVPIPVLRGVYAALPRNLFNMNRHRTIFYLSKANRFINTSKGNLNEPKYLASFQGSVSSNVRKRLFKLRLKSEKIVIRKEAPIWKDFIFGQGFNKNSTNISSYADLMSHSKFVLCPRGNGVSSYRIFETLEAGRVPVIIADQYVPPVSDDQIQYLLALKESKIMCLERFLIEKEKDYESLSKNADAVFHQNFSDERKVHYLGQQLSAISESSTVKNYRSLVNRFRLVILRYQLKKILDHSKIFVSRSLKKLGSNVR